jgi:hypothetical protein
MSSAKAIALFRACPIETQARIRKAAAASKISIEEQMTKILSEGGSMPDKVLINVSVDPSDLDWLKEEASKNFRPRHLEGGAIIHEMRDIRSKNLLGLKFPGEGKEV